MLINRVHGLARACISARAASPVWTGRNFDLDPNRDRFVAALAPPRASEAKQDKVIFIVNFFDELRRVAPANR